MKRRHPEVVAAVRSRAEESGRLVLKGIVLNLALAAVKGAGGLFGHSAALVADAIESLLDVATSALVWTGFKWAAQPPDEDHPYGHGKAEALAAFAVALVILGAATWISWFAVGGILVPHEAPEPWTLAVLALVIAGKTLFSRRLAQAGRQQGSSALGAEASHHLSDALTSAAAFIGITLSVLLGPGWETADDWAALLASAVIAANGVTVFRQALHDAMDRAAPGELAAEVQRVALGVAGVVNLDECRVRKSGLAYLVDLHVRVDPTITVHAGHEIAHAVKDALLAAPLRIGDVLVHIEPAQ
ncbi:MAG: cation diffusion facilitator family transporter [Opitutaceae bacterium]